jgi:uncharacterized RDD family membrane protein YckC
MGIAGFWTRVWAFLLDSFLLFLLLLTCNLLAGPWLARVGLWAYVVDLAITWLYFGLLSSRWTGGQTPGQQAMGIQVVARGGKPVSVARALARAVPLAIAVGGGPKFLSPEGGLEAVSMLTGSPLVIAAVSFFGRAIGFGTAYFYVFNTTTRQSLHDLATGTYVVRRGVAPRLLAGSGVLRLALVYLLLVAGGGAIALGTWPQTQGRIAEYKELAIGLSKIDGFLHLKTLRLEGDTLEVEVIWKPERTAARVEHDIARTVIAEYPGLQRARQLEITVGPSFGHMVKWKWASSRKMPVEEWKREVGL